MGHLNLAAGLNQPHSVMVVTADGYFYQFALDPVNGGECKLDRTYRWVGSSAGAAAVDPSSLLTADPPTA